MSATTLMLGAGAVGLILQTITLLGIVWKGGQSLGRLEEQLNRTVLLLDRLEERVGHLEGRHA